MSGCGLVYARCGCCSGEWNSKSLLSDEETKTSSLDGQSDMGRPNETKNNANINCEENTSQLFKQTRASTNNDTQQYLRHVLHTNLIRMRLLDADSACSLHSGSCPPESAWLSSNGPACSALLDFFPFVSYTLHTL